jgi:chemotaxis protein histidine kinase CheA
LVRELSQAQQQLQRLGSQIQVDGVGREALQEALRAALERLRRHRQRSDGLTNLHDRMEGGLRNLSDDLADEVTQARLVPLSELLDDYPRMLRDLAHELGKRVEPRIDGADNRIDRAVLERCATRCGIWCATPSATASRTPQERRRASGKPEVGRLVIEARQLGSMMRIRVADDGAGIDMTAARTVIGRPYHAGALGGHGSGRADAVPVPARACPRPRPSRHHPGRGFGLDIVKNAIDASGGHIGVHSERDQGTCFELQVPLMLSLTRCLLVQRRAPPAVRRPALRLPDERGRAVRRIDRTNCAR